jgi:Cu/Ag efflux protein CusF
MKAIPVISLVIAVIALVAGGYKINQLQKEQRQMAEDILKLKQEMARSWQETKASEKPEWPKYHAATGVLKLITGSRIIIDQDEMPGFMAAMIMSYEVENPEQLKGLKEGDRVKLRLKETETNLTVSEIEKQ